MQYQEFADDYNTTMLDEKGQAKKVIAEVRIKVGEKLLVIPSIEIIADNQISVIFHAYARHLRELEDKKAEDSQNIVVESMKIEYLDHIYLWKKLRDGTVVMQTESGAVVDEQSDTYKKLTELYEESTA